MSENYIKTEPSQEIINAGPTPLPRTDPRFNVVLKATQCPHCNGSGVTFHRFYGGSPRCPHCDNVGIFIRRQVNMTISNEIGEQRRQARAERRAARQARVA